MMSQAVTNPLVAALKEHKVSAAVVDLDHYRIHGGMAVETDYIISVQPTGDGPKKGEEPWESFRISKTYSAFRTLASQLHKISKAVTKKKESWDSLSLAAKNIVKLSESVLHLVESQKTEYLGKVNFTYVKSMAKQRSQILNDILDLLIAHFPEKIKGEDIQVGYMAGAIETFFLTDFCVEEDEEEEVLVKSDSKKKLIRALTPSKLKRHRSKGSDVPNLSPDSSPKRDKEETSTKTPKKTVRIEEPDAKGEAAATQLASPVVPITRKKRRSIAVRELDEDALQKEGGQANLLLDDDRSPSSVFPDYNNPVTVGKSGGSKIGDLVENNPYVFVGISAGAIYVLRFAADTTVTMDTDIAMLVVFAFFCLGFHMPRPQGGVEKPPPVKLKKPLVSFHSQRAPQRNASMLLRKSMTRRSILSPKASLQKEESGKGSLLAMLEEVEAEVEEGEEDPLIISPLPVYPKGAALGEHHNCWSEPNCDTFKVRGPKYLSDKKKVHSGPFVFPVRGVDLFLTDLCPENVGTNSGIMGGNLRDVPTFIINFRLPWGVLLFYFEIPEKLVPFLYKSYDPAFDDSTLPSLEKMTPGERTAARWLMGDQDYKNGRLKIVPVVQKGPWVVKSVVGGKPAIIGNKLPVTYIYQPPEGKKAAYIEADLDIVASSAARGILSVCSSATVDLTIDLGFVVEGREKDELPEKMLVAARLHGIDPMNAPPLPPSKDMFMFKAETMSTDEDDEDED